MVKTKASASSSKRPIVEEEPHHEEEENLSKTYDANFLILSHEEGARLTTIQFREILGCKYIPSSLLEKIGMLEPFNQLLNQCGLLKFVSMHEPSYVDLVLKFYTSLDVNEKDSRILEFRMVG